LIDQSAAAKSRLDIPRDEYRRAAPITLCHVIQPSVFCNLPHAAPYDFLGTHRYNISPDRSHHNISSILCHQLVRWQLAQTIISSFSNSTSASLAASFSPPPYYIAHFNC
jgi:hypothetical protein